MPYTVSCSTNFDAAHFLSNYDGPCKNIHGHRWSVTATLKSDTLIESGSSRGMVIDFSDVKPILNEIAMRFDHKLIYEDCTLRSTTLLMMEEEGFELFEINFRPTAENLAKYFYDELKEAGINASSVSVSETPNNSASYFEE